MSERPPDAGTPIAAVRSGLGLAREALARARADARGRGERPGAAGGNGPGSSLAETSSAGEYRYSQRRAAGRDDRSGPGPDERDPQLLGGTLDRLLAERGWSAQAAGSAVVAGWARIVGPEVAAHASPGTLAETELTVVADSTAWATQLRLVSGQLLQRIAEEVGPAVVTRVRVVGPTAPSWRRGRLSVRGRGPRDTYG